jgi:hypothetical protein
MAVDAKDLTFKRGGKDVILYKGLLALMHDKYPGQFDLRVKILQFPTSENGDRVISEATLNIYHEDNATPARKFTEIGDATVGNVGGMVADHFIRMAGTRAKGRVLRDALNIGAVSIEELGDDHDDDSDSSQASESRGRKSSTGTPRGKTPQTPQTRQKGTSNGSLSEGYPDPNLEPPLEEDSEELNVAVKMANDEQIKVIRQLARDLKPDDPEEVMTWIEYQMGYPAEMANEDEAGSLIERLNKRKAEKARGK